MTQRKTMAFEKIGDIYVLVHGTSAPSDEEWDAYLDSIRQVDISRMRSLAFTEGGAPSSAQRVRLQEIMGSRTSLAAVVSQNAWVRAVGKALSWANPSLKVFSLDELGAACRHLKLSEGESGAMERKLARLREVMGQGETVR